MPIMNNKFQYKNTIKEVLKMQDLDSNMLDDYTYEYITNSKNNEMHITEFDFYPPPDNRVWESYVEDIEGGDNFADYCEYIFDVLDEEEYFD